MCHRLLAVLLLALLAPAARAQDALVVGIKETPPFVIRGEGDTWTGISIELWERAAKRLGRTFTYRETDLAGLLRGVEDGSLDAAVAALSVTADREAVMDFTQPFHWSGLGIAVPARPEAGLGDVLSNLISWDFAKVLGSLVLLLVGSGVLVWLFERRRNAAQFGGPAGKGIGQGMWWSAVTMTTVGYGDKAPVTVGGRVIALVWMFAGIILISTFTAAITTSLTLARLETDIQGPDDLPGRRVASVADSSSAAYLRKAGIPAVAFGSVAEAIDALAAGRADAVVYDAPLLRYHAAHRYKGRIGVLPRTFARQGYAIALPRGSDLRKPLNQEILTILASDEWDAILRRYLGD
jgi:ABC-type amino acid transport substrate-binding protein